MTTSWELVGAAQEGDRQAFGQLYARHADVVSRYVLARVSDRALAEDLTSETFLRAWRRIGSVRDQGKDLTAWLTVIARNLVVDHFKSSRQRREVLTGEIAATADQARNTRRAGSSVEDAVSAAETAAEVHGYLAGLNPDQQQCVRLRFLHDRSVPETATAMGRSEGAVKALTHRALRNLAAAAGGPDHASRPVPAPRRAPPRVRGATPPPGRSPEVQDRTGDVSMVEPPQQVRAPAGEHAGRDAGAPGGAASTAGSRRDVTDQVREVEPMVRGICRARLGTTDGDDAAQRTLLGVWRALNSGREIKSVASYAAACARYEALSHYRDSRRRATPSGELAEQRWADEAPGPAEHAERVEDVAAATERVEALLGQLTPRQAEVLRAGVLAGRSTAETAQVLGITPTGAHSAQVRAMAHLRELCGTRSPNPLTSELPYSARIPARPAADRAAPDAAADGAADRAADLAGGGAADLAGGGHGVDDGGRPDPLAQARDAVARAGAATDSAPPKDTDHDGDTAAPRATGGHTAGVDGRPDPLAQARDAVTRAGAAADLADTDPYSYGIGEAGSFDVTRSTQEVEMSGLDADSSSFDTTRDATRDAGPGDDADAWDVA